MVLLWCKPVRAAFMLQAYWVHAACAAALDGLHSPAAMLAYHIAHQQTQPALHLCHLKQRPALLCLPASLGEALPPWQELCGNMLLSAALQCWQEKGKEPPQAAAPPPPPPRVAAPPAAPASPPTAGPQQPQPLPGTPAAGCVLSERVSDYTASSCWDVHSIFLPGSALHAGNGMSRHWCHVTVLKASESVTMPLHPCSTCRRPRLELQLAC